MGSHRFGTRRAAGALLCWLAVSLVPFCSTAFAQGGYVVTPVAERRLDHLPPGRLYWMVEGFPSLAQAQAAAGPESLAADVAGRAWLFTLGPEGGAGHGGEPVAKVGPVPAINSHEYLLRINHAGGPPGARTPVHMHPGSETFYVLSGRLSQRTPHGVMSVEAGEAMPGHSPGLPMEVSSSGTEALSVLVMFVVDATVPFSTPGTLE